MNMYENKFDPMMHELLKQKQLFEALVAENQELHRQLANLRAGRGFFLEIGGERFALDKELIGAAEGSGSSRTRSVPPPMQQTGPFTPVLPASARSSPEEMEAASPQTPTSVEAVRLAQASSTVTQSLPAVSPRQPTSSQRIEEEQASLRHELMGSFLLE